MTYQKILFSLGIIHKLLVTSIFFLNDFFQCEQLLWSETLCNHICYGRQENKNAQAIQLSCSIIMYMSITICIHYIIISAHIHMAL